MTHHCSDESLLSHLDGELKAESEATVVAHLESCWTCRSRAASLERQVHRLADVSERGLFPGPVWRNAAQARLLARIAECRLANSRVRQQRQTWQRFSLASSRHARWLTSLGLGALVLGAVLVSIPPKLEGKATLLRAVEAERQALRQLRVQHKTWSLEQYSAGRLIARRRVEHWQSSSAKLAALRVYDERHELIAGEWITANGRRTRRRKGQAAQTINRDLGEKPTVPRSIDEAVLFKLSTQEFLGLMGDDPKAEVRRDSGKLVVELTSTSVPADTGTRERLRATLVLTEEDLHPTRGVLVIDSSSRREEYRLQETALVRYFNEAPPARVFEPEGLNEAPPAMVASAPGRTAHPPEASTLEIPASVNPALEVRIIQKLALANLTLGEHVKLLRKQDGALELQARITSEDKKASVEATLADLLAEGGWTASFDVVPEEGFGLSPNADLRVFRQSAGDALKRQGVASDEASIGHLAQESAIRLFGNVQRMRNHAIAVREIGERFRQDDLARLQEEQRDNWKTAVFQHIQALRTETVLLEHELSTLSQGDEPADVPGSAHVTPTIQSLSRDVETINGAIKLLVSPSRGRSRSGVSQVRELLQLVRSCQRSLEVLAPAFETQ